MIPIETTKRALWRCAMRCSPFFWLPTWTFFVMSCFIQVEGTRVTVTATADVGAGSDVRILKQFNMKQSTNPTEKFTFQMVNDLFYFFGIQPRKLSAVSACFCRKYLVWKNFDCRTISARGCHFVNILLFELDIRAQTPK